MERMGFLEMPTLLLGLEVTRSTWHDLRVDSSVVFPCAEVQCVRSFVKAVQCCSIRVVKQAKQ